MPAINSKRLLDDLARLRQFGATGSGVVRLSFSDVDMDSRRWLVGQMLAANLDARIDGVGNVFGRSRNEGPAIVMGSHSDTQVRGGWLDGAMGVIFALEIARALQDDPSTAGYALDIGSWMDEEGTYLDCLGSAAFTGVYSDEQILGTATGQGSRLRDVISAAGLLHVPIARLEPNRHCAYLEAHIEQGPVLEARGMRIGVVSSIVGIRTFLIDVQGQQNHAGTTPMDLRRDAGESAIEIAHDLLTELRRVAGQSTVYTIGKLNLDPGGVSIIAGRAELSVQVRDSDETVLDELERLIRSVVGRHQELARTHISLSSRAGAVRATPMDGSLRGHLEMAAERHAPGDWITMRSGAGHDAQLFAPRIPCGMLFVPSINGISHDFTEDTALEDITLGCQVMATATASILAQLNRDHRPPEKAPD